MGGLPEDAEARREWLERWSVEQQVQLWEAKQRRWHKRLARTVGTTWGQVMRVVDRGLDRGLNSSGVVGQAEHLHPDRNGYVPSRWFVVPRALGYLGVSERDTFVDFGCGKGRVVHQAARRPFRRVIGVEVSPALAEAARAGLAARRHQHRCRDVEIVVADAAEYRVPDDLTIGYFFHPFVGETLAAVLRGIIDSIDRRPRRVRLIFAFPASGSQVLATGRFRLLKELRGGLRDTRFSRIAIFENC